MNNKVYRINSLYLFPHHNGKEMKYKIMFAESSQHMLIGENRDRWVETYRVVSNDEKVIDDCEYCSEPTLNKTAMVHYNEDVTYNLSHPTTRKLSYHLKNKDKVVYTYQELMDLEKDINLNQTNYIFPAQIESDAEHFKEINIQKLVLSRKNCKQV